MKKNFVFLILIIFCMNLFSCRSVYYYPKEKIIKITKEKIKKETGKDVNVFFSNTTLYITASLDGALTKSMEVTSEIYDIIQNIVLISTNVAISGDSKIDFFVVIIKDPLKKIKLTFTQNVEDTKRWIYGLLARSDFHERSLYDVKIYDENEAEEFPEILMENFIIDQTINVLKTKVKEEESSIAETLKQEANKRIEMIKKTGTIPNDILENIKKLIQTNRQYKYFSIYINLLKEAVYKKDSKVFEYIFQKFSDDNQNFVLINYDLFGSLLYETHKKICQKYNFTDYKKVILIEDNRIVFSSKNYE